MIQKKEQQIERLNELKTVLISEAVFGIRDVSNVYIPEYEYFEDEGASTEDSDDENDFESEEV